MKRSNGVSENSSEVDDDEVLTDLGYDRRCTIFDYDEEDEDSIDLGDDDEEEY